MDREIYLLMAGAIIAALVNVLMRLFEIFLRNIAKRLYFARSEKLEKKKIKQKLLGIEEHTPYKPDSWLDLWSDIGKLRGGGGTWFSQLSRIDYLLFALQWIVTIGAFLYWVIKIMPQLK